MDLNSATYLWKFELLCLHHEKFDPLTNLMLQIALQYNNLLIFHEFLNDELIYGETWYIFSKIRSIYRKILWKFGGFFCCKWIENYTLKLFSYLQQNYSYYSNFCNWTCKNPNFHQSFLSDYLCFFNSAEKHKNCIA